MKIDDYSLAFNCPGCPSWGTAIVNQDNDFVHLIKENVAKDIIIGIVHKSVPIFTHDFSIPLGKGSHVYYGDTGFDGATSEPVVLGRFEKVYINGVQIPAPFFLAIVKDRTVDHPGRLQLKYQPKIVYGEEGNLKFFECARSVLGISEETPWLFKTIDVRNQEELHFTALTASTTAELDIENKKFNGATAVSEKTIKEAFKQFLLTKCSFEHPSTAHQYWKVISSDRGEIQFLKDIISEITEGRANSIFSVLDESEATLIWKKTTSDERNRSFQGGIVSAILGKYRLFLREYNVSNNKRVSSKDLQVIYFGAPGTGKSCQLEKDTESFAHIRTIFHPDSDYASFVGCYKPIMKDGKIVYDFRAQAFTNAYVSAWLTNEPFYLIIEEINRGNCAQIFGDIFQLLDRKDGVSDYSVVPDADLKEYLSTAFHRAESQELIQKNGLEIPRDILNGEAMRLPQNFFLRATMNTSDQSLFPMDSAFKRRWAWKHFSIKNEEKGFVIVVDENHKYDWWKTIESLNSKIYSETKSADKQLGYWFAKLPEGEIEISKEDFVSKVLFYLWNDVFKDYSFDAKNAFSEELQFDKFFSSDGKVDPGMVIRFMETNGIANEIVITTSESLPGAAVL